MGFNSLIGVGVIFLAFLVVYFLGIISPYWLMMIAIIFIIVGFVVGFLILGSGQENMWVGVPLFVFGIIMLLIIYFFPK
ncbi:MAG: hypothetical protein KAS32_07295 [Candidatus Peribacteraceae bacterium]|nr:hypothetical protein [Candidatus Peribacteraceae bacterium]